MFRGTFSRRSSWSNTATMNVRIVAPPCYMKRAADEIAALMSIHTSEFNRCFSSFFLEEFVEVLRVFKS